MARIAALYATFVFCLLHLVSSVTIPEPDPGSHKYTVAVSSFSLINPSRHMDKNYTANGVPIESRKLMLSVFLPIPYNNTCTQKCDIPYMPIKPAQASNAQFFGGSKAGVFDSMSYTHCCQAAVPIDVGSHPLVFIEPQVGTSRFLYSTLAKFVSANGAVVIMIDRPGDSSIVEYEDGLIASRNNASSASLSPFGQIRSWNDTIDKVIGTRIQDINFVLDSISPQWLLQRHFANFTIKTPINTASYSVIGHGLGGTTVTMLGTQDPRVRFSINMSGSAPLLTSHSNATTYFFGRSDFRREHDRNWNASWPQLTGKATEWDLQDSAMFDFCDLPWIVDLAKQKENLHVVGKGLGSVGPNGYHITACFVEAYVRMELLDDLKSLTDCARLFPEMVPYTAFELDE